MLQHLVPLCVLDCRPTMCPDRSMSIACSGIYTSYVRQHLNLLCVLQGYPCGGWRYPATLSLLEVSLSFLSPWKAPESSSVVEWLKARRLKQAVGLICDSQLSPSPDLYLLGKHVTSLRLSFLLCHTALKTIGKIARAHPRAPLRAGAA